MTRSWWAGATCATPGRCCSDPWPRASSRARPATSSSWRDARARRLSSPMADVILRDGRTLRLRAPDQSDGEALVAFLEALSPESMSARYHAAVRPRISLVDPYLDADCVDRGALIGTSGRRRARARRRACELRPAARSRVGGGRRRRRRRPAGRRRRHAVARAGRSARGGERHRAPRLRDPGGQPPHAGRRGRRRVRRRAARFPRGDRGDDADRVAGRLPRSLRPPRSRRRSRFPPGVPGTGERGRLRGLSPARDHRRRAVPQSARRGIPRRRAPGQSQLARPLQASRGTRR